MFILFHLIKVILRIFSIPTSCPTYKWKFSEDKTKLRPKCHKFSSNMLYIILTSSNYKGGNFIANKVTLMSNTLILYTVHPLNHLIVKRASVSPSNGSRDDYDISPQNNLFVNFYHLVIFIHL